MFSWKGWTTWSGNRDFLRLAIEMSPLALRSHLRSAKSLQLRQPENKWLKSFSNSDKSAQNAAKKTLPLLSSWLVVGSLRFHGTAHPWDALDPQLSSTEVCCHSLTKTLLKHTWSSLDHWMVTRRNLRFGATISLDPFPHWFLLPPWLPSCIQGASRWTHLLNHYGSKLFLAHPAEKQEALQHFQRKVSIRRCWHSCLKWKFSFIFESAYCRMGNCRWTVQWQFKRMQRPNPENQNPDSSTAKPSFLIKRLIFHTSTL